MRYWRVDVSFDETVLGLGLDKDRIRQSLMKRMAQTPGFKEVEKDAQASVVVWDILLDEHWENANAVLVVALKFGKNSETVWRLQRESWFQVPMHALSPQEVYIETDVLVDELLKDGEVLWKASQLGDRRLLKEAQKPMSPMRFAAMQVLSSRKNKAVFPELLKELQSKDIGGVRRAVGFLVELQDERAASALAELFLRQGPLLRQEVLYAVAAVGGESAKAFLFTIAQGEDDEHLALQAKELLGELEGATERRLRVQP
ncbi:MAG: HEAT repeat domain-containing protein [Cystobacterineae bacterium]|nr:HEAT repeat domain-containing protein [Cystobacterineae bacterium]